MIAEPRQDKYRFTGSRQDVYYFLREGDAPWMEVRCDKSWFWRQP